MYYVLYNIIKISMNGVAMARHGLILSQHGATVITMFVNELLYLFWSIFN